MKRTFWAATGFTLGFGSSVYLQKRLRRAVERYSPEQVRRGVTDVSRRAATKTRDLISDLREAAQDGSEAMRQTEHDLRSEFVAGREAHRHRPARIRH
ncbi:MAG: hypothetical protein OXB92_04065 [Acidimicrobiaceae bacterium]|nr:hypothetical protein [Acidimicrobiia bacterium]MCY4493019.1 hypothetical protein [Acidimicrobiaceae bacterium]